jgi:AraC family ethanolamine operon transcriptional activator
MEQQPSPAFSVADLADTVRVSERTLRAAFLAYFGVGPSRYMKLRQLNQVHRDLKAASPDESTVSGIVLQNGVWEHGRFASAYRRFFGETPSTTLRSAPH